ncbi:MAG: PBP1A family penicillin-binding protein [Nitrospiria bacterium]
MKRSKRQGKKRGALLLRTALALVFLGVCFSAAYVVHIDREAVKKFEGQRWKLPSKIYSAPFRLSIGTDIDQARLIPRLKRLAYRRVNHPVRKRGEYYLTNQHLELYLHEFSYPDYLETGTPFRISMSNRGQIEQIIDLSLVIDQDHLVVEPEMIGGFYESEWEERRLVRLTEIPQALIDAVLVMEDRKFFDHPGIDLKSIARASWVNLWAGKIVQGGSTLTQQLVKNFYLDGKKTWRRKGREALLALLLERHYSKEEILEAYLNEIYLGQNGIMGIYGIGQAAWFYFEKAPHDLSLGESALLSGIIRSPNIFSPTKDIHKAIRRRNLVLEKMFSEGKIGLQDYLQARNEKVTDKEIAQRLNAAPYFIDHIRRQLVNLYPPRILNSGGLRIFTTLDVEMQRAAEASVRTGLERLEKDHPRLKRFEPDQQLQGAIVAIDPDNGAVRALVGGRDYKTSQFNRITDAKRQPGSLFKPIVYLAAFDQTAKGGTAYTPVSQVDDAPITIHVGGKDWSPENYDKQYLGPLTLRAALEGSRNTATVRLSQEIGIDSIVAMANKIGVESPLQPVPSLALGSIEVTPLEMGIAYSTLANGGIRHKPEFLSGIFDPSGLPIEREQSDETHSRRVVSAEAAYLVTDLMKGVIDAGTARGVRQLGFEGPAAGKTGTTSKLRDAWFVGYTPDLVTLVWVGFDQNQAGRFTGSSAALPIWTSFMKKASFELQRDFEIPSGIIIKSVNPHGIICEKEGRNEPFIKGTEPTKSCDKGIIKWIKQFFF